MPVLIRSMNQLKRGQADSTYAIVRSMKNKSDWIEQLDTLSPSQELFFDYRQLAEAGRWNSASFDEMYLPRFLSEMCLPKAVRALNDIAERSASDETIALACFCADESLCHRSIIAGILQGMGVEVDTVGGADYSGYYDMWAECDGRIG